MLGGYTVEYLKRNYITTAEFDSRDESYSWILNWLNDHPYSKQATRFSVATTISRSGQKITGEGEDSVPVYLLPSPGMHFFTYQGRLLWLSRERIKPSAVVSNITAGSHIESISISTLGRCRDVLQDLVLEAKEKFIERDTSRTIVFAADQYGTWRRTRSRPRRPLNSIVLESGLKSFLVEDAGEFLSSETWYSDRGIPYRRGYLLYGTPGSGKTSFIHALAGELGLNIYVVNLANKSLTDDTLTELVTDTPTRCILLIEDVDAAFVHRDKNSNQNNVTFSGLLNAIDGVAAQEGRLLCMTTNHIDHLDPALIRPGRIDVRAYFGAATNDQARELFERFYPVDSMNPQLDRAKQQRLAEKFAEIIPNRAFSMAQLQGFLMSYKKRPEAAVENAVAFVQRGGKGFSESDFGDESHQPSQ
ncbi:mitochondrial chaperone BCS1-like protein [Basidiobolus meristosporus CBS 931.73]|uniref:Mitochondrial chaperone BCS1-like protein n=1 Tax=Basidiobolus meristosporus CBS 931.73 TaxID=1314790 RepID=A0A1Y1Z913_9FUNG|nr:mitochondrial chaperone BCS1-like protein [Basidiobolus meristosporus CBS 931.73]|eukprot:ORY06295.1 mitochondrial chaperone BCS1-like protein [Basidiobolus meristosporus CBS 931.73]